MTDASISTDQPEISPPAASAVPDAASVPGADETPDSEHRSVRQRVVDHLLDTEGPQHVSMIVQGTGLDRRVVDPVLSRGVKAGVFLRVAEAVYALAPEKPAEPLPPAPAEVPRADGIPATAWVEWLHTWSSTGKWQGPGRAPHPIDGITVDGCAVPLDCWLIFKGERDAIEAARRVDDALRAKLFEAAYNNVRRSAKLDDLALIKIVLASGVSLENVEFAIRSKHDPRIAPRNRALESWDALLPHIALTHVRSVLVPKMVEKWRARLADLDKRVRSPALRRAMSEIAPQAAADTSNVAAAAQVPPAPVDAPVASSAHPAAISDDEGPRATTVLLERFGAGLNAAAEAVSGDDDAPPAMPASRPQADGRDQILARFARPRPGAAPATPPPARADRSEIAERVRDHRQGPGARPITSDPGSRPWFAPGPQPHSEVPDETWRFLLEGFSAGNMPWGRRYGPAPEMPGCRVPPHLLREFGYYVED